jgi:hypothetical protein
MNAYQSVEGSPDRSPLKEDQARKGNVWVSLFCIAVKKICDIMNEVC